MDQTDLPKVKTAEWAPSASFLPPALLSAFLLAALLAIVLRSLNIFLFVLGVSFVPLAGAFYPLIMVALFLFFDLLFPKLPLIQIQGYLVPIRIEDVFLAFALLCLLLRYLICRERQKPNPLLRWMLVFSLATGLSLLFGLFILRSVPGAKIGFLFWLRAPEYFAACYLCLLGVTSWKQYHRIVVALVVFVLLIGVYGILQELSLVPIFNALHMTDELVVIQFSPSFGADRLFSTFAGPNDLAASYLIVIPILTALLVLSVSRATKVVLAGVLALSFFCFYLTFARAALVGLAVVLSVCLWMLNKRGLALALALLCVLPALIFSGYVERLAITADDPFSAASLGGRLESVWVSAFSAFSRSPLLGTGPASLTEDGMGVDGLYMLLLGMWGIGGLICFFILIGKAIHSQRDCIRLSRNNTQRALAIGLFAGTLGLLVNGITMDTFFSSKVAFAYWFLMGLLLVGRHLEGRSSLAITNRVDVPREEGRDFVTS